MQDRGPATNVILEKSQDQASPSVVRIENVRVRKDARDVCLNDALRQRFQPALWPPLGRIRAPDGRVTVHAEDVEPHGRTCRDDKLMQRLAICTLDRAA